MTDSCEIARNSVLQSGFESEFKAHFLGENFMKAGASGNGHMALCCFRDVLCSHILFCVLVSNVDIRQTNVPTIRILYRDELLKSERDFILRGTRSSLTYNRRPVS